MSSWRSAVCILWLAAFTATAQTNQQPLCCRYPVRIFGGASVNLTPLFDWWSPKKTSGTATMNAEDSFRPLPAWKRVRGTKVEDLGYQWLVDAEIFTNRTHSFKARIVLQNPPAPEEQTYYALKQQVAGYDQQITNAQHAYAADVKAEQHAQDRAHYYTHSWSWQTRLRGDAYARESTQKRNDATEAQTQETAAKQSLQTLQKELAAIPSEHGTYQIDLFALDTGKVLGKLPVYDVGQINYPMQ